MNEIEGAICDECGTKIGPMGCCATIRRLRRQVVQELDKRVALLNVDGISSPTNDCRNKQTRAVRR